MRKIPALEGVPYEVSVHAIFTAIKILRYLHVLPTDEIERALPDLARLVGPPAHEAIALDIVRDLEAHEGRPLIEWPVATIDRWAGALAERSIRDARLRFGPCDRERGRAILAEMERDYANHRYAA